MQLLTEHIQHIEDVNTRELIEIINSLELLQGSEKVDGSNIWIGIDENDKLYLSREGKSSLSTKKYFTEQWEDYGVNDSFKAAQMAILKLEDTFKEFLNPGQIIEAEIIFQHQSNLINYDVESAIVFLRPIQNMVQEEFDNFCNGLNNKKVEITTTVHESPDGIILNKHTITTTVNFITAPTISLAKIKKNDKFIDLRNQMNAYLQSTSNINSVNNKELLLTNLSSIPLSNREVFKTKRFAAHQNFFNTFITPIKNVILDVFVNNKKSFLGSDNIEGVVVKFKDNLVKLVNRAEFTSLNMLNQHTRQIIKSRVLSNVEDIKNGGILGQNKVRLFNAMGLGHLIKANDFRKFLAQPNAKNKLASLITRDFIDLKKELVSIVLDTTVTLHEALNTFTKNESVTVSKDRVVKLTDGGIKQTLITFAESFRTLEQLKNALIGADRVNDIIDIIVANPVKHDNLFESKGYVSKTGYKNLSYEHAIIYYIVTLVVSILFVKSGIKKYTRFVIDRRNFPLKSYDRTMSFLNMWAFVIFNPNSKDIKQIIPATVRLHVYDLMKNLSTNRRAMKNFHRDISCDNKIDWSKNEKLFGLFIKNANIQPERLNRLIRVFKWEYLSYNERVGLLNDILLILFQYMSDSLILTKFKEFETDIMTTKTDLLTRIALTETADAGSTSAAAVATVPMFVGGSSGKHTVIKRQRNPKIKELLMKWKIPEVKE